MLKPAGNIDLRQKKPSPYGVAKSVKILPIWKKYQTSAIVLPLWFRPAGLLAYQPLIAFRDVACQRADLKVILPDLSYRRNFCGGSGQPTLLETL